MKILGTGFIVFAIGLMPIASWAKAVSCSNLESTTYLNARSYHYERLRNPFGNWSENLIPEIERKFSECLAQYKKKYGEDGFKTKKVIKAKIYFESIKEGIATNLKIRQFQEINSVQLSKTYRQLEAELRRHGIAYSQAGGFSSKGSESIVLTNTDAQKLSDLINPINTVAKTYMAFSEQHNIFLGDITDNATHTKIDSGLAMPKQFASFSTGSLSSAEQKFNHISRQIISTVDSIIASNNTGDLNAVSIYKQSGGYDLFDITREHSELKKQYQAFELFVDKYSTVFDNSPNVDIPAQLVIDKYQQYKALIHKGEIEHNTERDNLTRKKQATANASAAYLKNIKTLGVAAQFSAIGYPDAMLSLGRLGNPFDSTYATVQCLSSLYAAVEVSKSGKQVEINFGDNGVFGIKPQYTMKLKLVKDYVAQYVLMDLISHDESASTTSRGKVLHFVSLVRQCEKRNGIKLIN